MNQEQEINIRVYYEDTDAGGIVYYANYLKFAERGRTEFLRSAGLENKSLMDKQKILFVARRVEADYLSPAYLDDNLRLITKVSCIKGASFVMKQDIYRDEKHIFSADVTLVCVNLDGKPVRMPLSIKEALL